MRQVEVTKVVEKKSTNNKYLGNYDVDYFNNVDSYKKAALLGFIQGDGSVYRSTLIITQNSKEMLVKIWDAIKDKNYAGKAPIYSRRSDCKNPNHHSLQLRSIELCNNLDKYGIYPQKSFTRPWIINIDEKYEDAWVVGAINADGWVYDNSKGMRIGYSTGSKENIDGFISYLKKHNINYVYSLNKNTHIVNVLRRNDMIKLLDRLLSLDIDDCWLERKLSAAKFIATLPLIEKN